MIILLIPYGLFVGLIVATFLLIAAWFAWTPLPLIVRMPVALVVLTPFGIIASAFALESELAAAVAAVTWLTVVMGFAADRSAAYTLCLAILFLFCFVPLLIGTFLNPSMTDQLDFSRFGFLVVLMLHLAGLCLPLRFLGYRLQRLTPDAGDHPMRLISEKSVDEWIIELQRGGVRELSFAETVQFVGRHGVPSETAQRVAKAVCHALGKPTPKRTSSRADGGLTSWLQWATTGPRREQYSVRQLMLWVAACSILFAILARTGVDRDALTWWFEAVPTIILLAAAINLLGWGWLKGQPRGHRFVAISGGCLCLCLASSLSRSIQTYAAFFPALVPAILIGSALSINYWLMHLRREGFRLIPS